MFIPGWPAFMRLAMVLMRGRDWDGLGRGRLSGGDDAIGKALVPPGWGFHAGAGPGVPATPGALGSALFPGIGTPPGAAGVPEVGLLAPGPAFGGSGGKSASFFILELCEVNGLGFTCVGAPIGLAG